MWECEWWLNFKTNEKIRNHIRSNFPHKRSLSTESLLEKIRNASLYGNFQCDLVVPGELKAKFANFSPILKNSEVGRIDIVVYIQNYATGIDFLKHPQRMLISGFKLEIGSIISPFSNFYLKLGLPCTKARRFSKYFPRKSFNKFVQSVVDARKVRAELLQRMRNS